MRTEALNSEAVPEEGVVCESPKFAKLSLATKGYPVLDVTPGELHLANNGPPVFDVSPGELHLTNSGLPVIDIETGKLQYWSSSTDYRWPLFEVTDSSLTFYKPWTEGMDVNNNIAFQVDADGNVKASGEILANQGGDDPEGVKRRLDDKTEKQTALEAKVERLEAALADEKTANNANKAKAEALEEKMAVIEANFAALEAKLTAA